MKSEWVKCKIGDVSEIIMGQSPESCFYNSDGNGVPFLQGNRTFGRMYPTFDTFTTKVTKMCHQNDIIMSVRAPVGEINIAPIDFCLGRGVCAIRAKEIPQIFLYYALKFCVHILIQRQSGTVFGSVNREDIKNLEILLPPLPTQQKIAAILSALDAKIENNNAINRNLEQQAQALFKSWFVDFEPFGGVMPEGWREGKLKDIADITMGQSPNGKSYNMDGRGMVFYQGRAEFGYRFPSRNLFTTEPKRLAERFDVLMSVRAPVGDLNIANEQCCIGRGLCAVRSKDDQQSFVFYTLQNMKRRLKQFDGEGTVFGSINKDSVQSLNIILPSNDYLDKFENFVSKTDRIIFDNCEQNTRLAALRDTLLPKLMSGEIEV